MQVDRVDPASPLTGRSVLVTGGSGAFGQAFVRRALDDGAARVSVFSRSESKQADMAATFRDSRLRFRIGDVRDYPRLVQVMGGVDTVIHSAALKRVEVCQADVREAKRTNVDGTENVALAAIECSVRRAVYLSTDKASEPNTFYGSSKHLGEGLWNGMNAYAVRSGTLLSSTRYGNVLESTGSVVPLWRKHAAAGTPLPITDLRMSRFFMQMSDAVDLVILALREMRGGEVFVPSIGSAPIRTLAEAVAPESALEVVGIRRGEKLHETLIGEDEGRDAYDHWTHYRIEPERTWTDEPPWSAGRRVPDGFSYRSDTNPRQLSVEELRGMVAA